MWPRKHKPRRQGHGRSWLRVLLLPAAVALYGWARVRLVAPAPAAPGADELRVVSWNLRRLGDPQAKHDRARIRAHLLAQAPTLMAVQEVYSAATLRGLLPDWEVRLSDHGGHGHQRLGFWWHPESLRAIGPARQLDAISFDKQLRPALAQHFEVRSTGQRFWAATVHLKARPQGAALRREQWRELSAWIGGISAPHEALLLLGDFNTTGSPGTTPDEERAALGIALRPAGMRPVPNPAGCSVYWEGAVRDRTLQASLLDLVWARGFAQIGNAAPGAHCARHSCQSFQSSPNYPDLDYEEISDHCPVRVDLGFPRGQ